ncbi:hypothetical protein HOLleu_10818 [Holothuria leucospilota]|uniref:Uncharacterized protein n=1 Tax=Holothuria leucospilota TaxID=206669 RepID=A0A9Q1HBY1_HOLLE|nr:hypothetical protein HOLleu_10818 [Holothuria leucospilota]
MRSYLRRFVPPTCQCGYCIIMPTARECRCCVEVREVHKWMEEENAECITTPSRLSWSVPRCLGPEDGILWLPPKVWSKCSGRFIVRKIPPCCVPPDREILLGVCRQRSEGGHSSMCSEED